MSKQPGSYEFIQLVEQFKQHVPTHRMTDGNHIMVKSAGLLFDFECFGTEIVVSVLGTAECCSNSFDSIIHFLASEYSHIPAFQSLLTSHHYHST